MNDELKSLIEDAAKLLGVDYDQYYGGMTDAEGFHPPFNPCDPERGDLMKVAEAAELTVDDEYGFVFFPNHVVPEEYLTFTKGDHESKVLAILRAASAVLHGLIAGDRQGDIPDFAVDAINFADALLAASGKDKP